MCDVALASRPDRGAWHLPEAPLAEPLRFAAPNRAAGPAFIGREPLKKSPTRFVCGLFYPNRCDSHTHTTVRSDRRRAPATPTTTAGSGQHSNTKLRIRGSAKSVKQVTRHVVGARQTSKE